MAKSKTGKIKRAHLAETLFKTLGGAKKSAEAAVKDLFLAINEILSEGNSIKIYRFGKFALKEKKARKGRNPATSGKIIIPGRRALVFYPSPILNKKLKRPGSGGGRAKKA